MKNIMSYVLILAIFAVTPAMAEREYSFNENDSFDGSQVATIKIDVPRGEIELTGTTGDQIEIDFKNVIYAESQKDADEINKECSYKAETIGDRLVITVDVPGHSRRRGVLKRLLSGDWDDDINPYLRVKIPNGKSVAVKSSSADMDISGLTLNLDVRSSSSDIKMNDTEGNATFDLSSGDVDVNHHKGDLSIQGNSSDLNLTAIDGDLDLKTSSGDGRLDGIKGSVSVYASSGDYRLNTIDGDLDARTSSGDIYAAGISGSVRAEASSGDIVLKELSSRDGSFDIESSSGDVTLEVSESFEGTIALNSNSGSVNSRLSGEIESLSETSLRGSVGTGSGKLRVSTISGDIRIDRF